MQQEDVPRPEADAAAGSSPRMRTLLICHEGAALTEEGIARWMASFSELTGVVVLREARARKWKRVRRELRRVGALRFLDVLAFRLYYGVFLSRKDKEWEARQLEELRRAYPPVPEGIPRLLTDSPNSEQAERFIAERSPDLVLARCKVLLKERIFSIPPKGTFVLHPGICPQYRNSHGCFWALANGDRENVGMTLLKVDRGVDTGPVYSYHRASFDETKESHVVIQQRVVLANLGAVQRDLQEIFEDRASPLDTRAAKSAAWGQPQLTRYWRWKARARRGRS